MTSYNPPDSIVPIFCPTLWPSRDDTYSQIQANQKFVQTGNVNQNISGAKAFTDLQINGDGYALQWNRSPGVVTTLANTAGNPWVSGFLLPTYGSNVGDTLVANTNQTQLSNKTMMSLKVGINGSTSTLVQHGITVQAGGGTSRTITFPTAFAAGTTPVLQITYVRNDTAYFFTATVLSVNNTSFTYRCAAGTMTNPAQWFLAGDSHDLHWVAIGTA